MKNLLFAALLSLLGAPLLYAQQDTTFTTVKEETGDIEPQHYETQYDQAFRTMTPAKWMFKWDMSKLVPVETYNTSVLRNTIQVKVGGEYKMSKCLSIGVDYTLAKGNTSYLGSSKWDTYHQALSNVRWYHNMSRKIKEGRSANNFSGNYIGLQSGLVTRHSAVLKTEISKEFQFAIRYGMQRRLLKRSFIDLSYGLGANYEPAKPGYTASGTWRFSANQQFAIGLAHFSPRKNTEPSGGFCDVLHCFDEDKRMLKIDLLNVLNIGEFSKKVTNAGFTPSIALEQKLGASPFSVEATAKGDLSYFQLNADVKNRFNYKSLGGSVEGEIRWYYNLKRRILTGKSGNNLSGPFLALNAGQYWGMGKGVENSTNSYTSNIQTTTAKMAWGVQQRIFDNAFVQFKIGHYKSWTYLQYKNYPIFNDYYTRWKYFTEVKVGLAF